MCVLDTANLVFTIIFTVEMILKLIAYGIGRYCKDPFDVFDGMYVCMCVCVYVCMCVCACVCVCVCAS